MRYPASEKLEIIRTVERSHLFDAQNRLQAFSILHNPVNSFVVIP